MPLDRVGCFLLLAIQIMRGGVVCKSSPSLFRASRPNSPSRQTFDLRNSFSVIEVAIIRREVRYVSASHPVELMQDAHHADAENTLDRIARIKKTGGISKY